MKSNYIYVFTHTRAVRECRMSIPDPCTQKARRMYISICARALFWASHSLFSSSFSLPHENLEGRKFYSRFLFRTLLFCTVLMVFCTASIYCTLFYEAEPTYLFDLLSAQYICSIHCCIPKLLNSFYK